MKPRVKVCEVAVFDEGDHLSIDIGEQASSDAEYFWYLLAISAHVAIAIKNLADRMTSHNKLFSS